MYCEICKNNFNKHYFGLHLKKEHKINSKEYYDKYLKNENEGICCECGNETTFISLLNGYRKFCSYICRSSSNIIKEKIKQTNLEKYGVENVFSSNEIKNKIKQTNLNKFGVENPSQNEEIKNKIKQTNLKKYNVENVFQLSNTKEKIKQTHNEKYINKHKNIDILSINNNLITFKCKICNNICTENKLFIMERKEKSTIFSG